MSGQIWTPPTEEEQIRNLFSLGYFQGKEWEEVRRFMIGEGVVQDALDKYRDRHGLSGSDDPGTHMLFPRCGMPDFAIDPLEAGQCKWPMQDVTCSHRLGGLNPLSAAEEHECWMAMIENWNSVCGIRLRFIDDMSSANIYADPGNTGPGVLAYSYLPCNASKTDRMQQVYNRSTNWSKQLLIQVMTHEVGHAIGLGHGPNGSLMQPTASGTILKPQQWDISEVVSRYGKPQPKPDPVPGPGPTPGPGGTFDVEIKRTLAPGRYRFSLINNASDDDSLVMG